MKKNFHIVAIIVLSVGIVTQVTGWGLSDFDPTNKNSALRKGAKDLDPTNPYGSMGKDLHARVKICNNTQGKIFYNLAGREYTVPRGQCNRGNLRGQPVITFDRLFIRGFQRHTYTLNDGTYSFVPVSWHDQVQVKGRVNGIDLRRK